MKCEEESISFICSESPVVITLYFTFHPGRSSGALLLDLLQPAKVFPLKPNRHQRPTIISQTALPIFPSWNTQLSGPYLIKYSFKMINLNVKLSIFLPSTPTPVTLTFTHLLTAHAAPRTHLGPFPLKGLENLLSEANFVEKKHCPLCLF